MMTDAHVEPSLRQLANVAEFPVQIYPHASNAVDLPSNTIDKLSQQFDPNFGRRRGMEIIFAVNQDPTSLTFIWHGVPVASLYCSL